MERKFGRLASFDERSRNFNVRQISRGLEPKTTYWNCSKVLDQGTTMECVGNAFAHELIAEPVPVLNIGQEDAHKFYKGAQAHDEWPGDDYEGSSVLGVARYGVKEGWLEKAYWGFSLLDWKLGMTYKGPAILGISWMTGMMTPNSEGFVRVKGENEGGHAILCNGYNHERRFWTLHNSWGPVWGINGECYVSDEDMDKLREDRSECMFPEGRHDITVQPEKPGVCKSTLSRWL